MKKNVSYASAIGVTSTYLIMAEDLHAQESSISIYPPVIEIQTTPPSSPISPIQIQNNSEEDITLKISLIPFKSNNISGDIILTPLEATKGLNPYMIERIQFLIDDKKATSVSLAPLEKKEIFLNINLAKGDPIGDFYYSIAFINTQTGTNNSNRSQLPNGIASNLLLSVGPQGTPTGGISEFKTSFFKTHGPVEFNLKLHNASPHLISPTGIIEITNIFGQKVGSIDLLSQYVTAGSDRYLVDKNQSLISTTLPNQLPEVVWPEKILFGWYKAEALIKLNETSKPISSQLYFVAFPLYFFFALVIILFVIISIYLRVKKKI